MKRTLVVLFLFLSVTTFGQKFETNVLYIDMFYENGNSIYCGTQEVKYSFTKGILKRDRIILSSEKFEIDVAIVKRNVGEYNSDIGKTRDDRYYYISGIKIGDGVGILFQPIEVEGKQVKKIYYLPSIAISANNLCQ